VKQGEGLAEPLPARPGTIPDVRAAHAIGRSPTRSIVGAAGASLDVRCRAAVTNLTQHGWLRVKEDRVSWPRARRTAPMAERKAPLAAA